MITYDRLKMRLPISCITIYDSNVFNMTVSPDGETIRHTLKKIYQKLGVTNLVIDEQNQWVELDVNSKLLKDNYYLLINRYTYLDLFKEINRTGIIQIDTDELLQKVEVRAADVTLNIALSGNAKKAFEALGRSYIGKYYQTYKHKNSVEFRSTKATRTEIDRLIVYDKDHEINLQKNHEFLATCKDPNRLKNRFKGKVRIELNIKSLPLLRRYLSLEERKPVALFDTLFSSESPLAQICQIIGDDLIQHIIPIDPELLTLKQVQMLGIIKLFEGNLEVVERMIRSKYRPGTNLKKIMRGYREISVQLQQENELSKGVAELVDVFANIRDHEIAEPEMRTLFATQETELGWILLMAITAA